MGRIVSEEPRHLVALEQCGLELQAPHLRTRTKRRIETSEVDVATLSTDSLRFTGWAPDKIEAIFPDLRPDAAYEIEATYLCERDVHRVQALTSRGVELHPPIELARATATVVRIVVPSAAYADGTLELTVERIAGPDVVMSELRLFSSEPSPPAITVVGDSRGGLIGTVGAPDGAGLAGVPVHVGGDAGSFTVTTDAAGVFRIPLNDGLSLGRHGEVTIATGSDSLATEITANTRHLALGLRELPPPADRLDLNGEWGFAGGSFGGHGPVGGRPPTRVPGHVVYDGLVPDDGVATFHRTIDVPESWAERAIFLRCDGAYGRAEVHVNGSLAGVHGSGATSFDVDLTPFLRPAANELAITLTEYTPHAVLDDMSWYAHMSLLGIWRDVFLFSTSPVHLGQLEVDADWDPERGVGSLNLGVDVINAEPKAGTYDLEVTIRGDAGEVIHRASRHGSIDGAASAREAFAAGPLTVRPWSAEEPRRYELEVVVAADGGAAQTYRRRIGFRRVETRGNQLIVNGAPIRIRGVNRHDSRILKGRALSAEDMRSDVVNLRRANVNVIRTSHYPPSPHLLDVCDEVGMFVFEQPPICFSGGFDDHHWTRTNEDARLIPYLLEVTAETVARDQGRCSVIVWDLGNESRWGSGFDAQLALVRSMDPSRPTIFSFDLNELGDENQLVRKSAAERPDIRSYHYPGWDRTWQEDLAWLGSYEQPVVLDEYAPRPRALPPRTRRGLRPGDRSGDPRLLGRRLSAVHGSGAPGSRRHRRDDLGRVRGGVRDPARPDGRRGPVGPSPRLRLRSDARPLSGRARRLSARRWRLGPVRCLEPVTAGALARPRDVLADRRRRSRLCRVRRPARPGPGQPVLASLVRGARRARGGRRGRRRHRRADRRPGRDGAPHASPDRRIGDGPRRGPASRGLADRRLGVALAGGRAIPPGDGPGASRGTAARPRAAEPDGRLR